jgi:hypothetical protein
VKTVRRLSVALLSACLVGLSAGVVSAQAPSPTLDVVGVGGRVALPEHGFALTFPDDWAWVRDSSRDFDEVMTQLADLTSPEFVAEWGTVFREVGADVPLSGTALEQGGSCGIGVQPTDISLDAFAANYVGMMEGQPDLVPGGATLTDVALPAGPAKRVDWRFLEDGAQTAVANSMYLLTDGGRTFGVLCTDFDPPADLWLSIARTLEFLPAEEPTAEPSPGAETGTGPVVLGGRIEVPAAGFALTVPAGAYAFDLDDPDLVAEMEAFDEQAAGWSSSVADLDIATSNPAFAAAYPLAELHLVALLPGAGSCTVVTWPTATDSLDQLVGELMPLAQELPDVLTDVKPTFADLPAGRTGIIWITQRMEAWTSGRAESTLFLFLHEGTVFDLTCAGPTRTERVWLPIARSIEFLPTEAAAASPAP